MNEPEGAIIMLAGPIKYWWDDNWDTPEHWHYAAWRAAVNDGAVGDGYLVYRPHEAFKGRWTERAQSVNDMVLRLADVILNLTPKGVPTLGTDGELLYAQTHGSAKILDAPPTEDFQQGVDDILARLNKMNIKRALVDQEIVIESFEVASHRRWMFSGAIEHYAGQVIRLHYENQSGLGVVDASRITLPIDEQVIALHNANGDDQTLAFRDLLKLEVLARSA